MAQEATDVLFAIADTARGHRSAAEAMISALHAASNGKISCETRDLLQETNVAGLRNARHFYNQRLLEKRPFLFNSTYQLTNGRGRVNLLARLVFLRTHARLATTIRGVRPKLVVVVHPLLNHLMELVRRKYRFSYPIVTVVVDLVSLHASWACPEVDLCLFPTDEAYVALRELGMPAAKMIHTGFPIHPKFSRYTQSKCRARNELGVREGQFTILVTGGGLGTGHMYERVLELEKVFPDAQLLVVTGSNRALFAQLQRRGDRPFTHVYGFVGNMEVLIAASDVVVTKAGPNTIFEALTMRRPVIITEAVGSQEKGNIGFVLNHNLGLCCSTTDELTAAIYDIAMSQYSPMRVQPLTSFMPTQGAEHIAAILLQYLAYLASE